ncbi:MAG: hypothetical protein L3J97_01785 [Thermoplasmata archaeon]|nr:hypothetical protein [Thermoplasmata archaeon]
MPLAGPATNVPGKIVPLVLAVAILVVLSVAVPSYYLENGTGPQNAGTTALPPQLYVWAKPNYQGPFAGGIGNSSVLPVRELPTGTATTYVDGTLGTVAWVLYTNGLFNRSGNCDTSFSPPGACNVFVGIWTPAAWFAYAHGGSLDPLWCYPGMGEGCSNVSGGELTTPNLSAFDGTGWEIVIWNLLPYSLSGSYVFTVYSSEPP